jgi:hypothetical protein
MYMSISQNDKLVNLNLLNNHAVKIYLMKKKPHLPTENA